MADLEQPSFSLGLDLDAEPDPGVATTDRSAPNPGANSHTLRDDAEELVLEVDDSDIESGPNLPRVFKRLRRGPALEKLSTTMTGSESLVCNDGDEEIEEFSSSEEHFGEDQCPPKKYHSLCSSSKIPLNGCGVLTSHLSSQRKAKKKEHASDAPAPANLEPRSCTVPFPNLTISPLRRFQLLDSDSDDPSVSEDATKRVHKIGPSSKEHQSTINEERRNASMKQSTINEDRRNASMKQSTINDERTSASMKQSTINEERRNASTTGPQNKDLWRDFSPRKCFHTPTPAFDKVCEEYFGPLKDKSASKKIEIQKFEQKWDLSDSLPPSHCYFFHDDLRIQKLVCSRLPFFSPRGTVVNKGNQQPFASDIDFMSSKGQTSKENRTQKASKKSKSKKSNAEVPHGFSSAGWVEPKGWAEVSKNAGKGKFHAGDQSAGRWYTSPEGRKVYVSRSGHELTGHAAYRLYGKETGAGSRKSKKKSNARKKK